MKGAAQEARKGAAAPGRVHEPWFAAPDVAAVMAAALEKIAESDCTPSITGACVGAIHSRRKRYDNPERVERVGCAKHYAAQILTACKATDSQARS